MHDCTTHAVRRSAMTWGGRSGAAFPGIVANSHHHAMGEDILKYLQEGVDLRVHLLRNGGADPLWKLWVYKDVMYRDVLSR